MGDERRRRLVRCTAPHRHSGDKKFVERPSGTAPIGYYTAARTRPRCFSTWRCRSEGKIEDKAAFMKALRSLDIPTASAGDKIDEHATPC